MDTLADRLKSLGVKLGAQDLPPPRPRSSHAIEGVVPGQYRATPFGEIFVAETMYEAGYRHGREELRLATSLHTVGEWAREVRLTECEPDSFVFLDTETTGLAGGTGTYAFLVGLGRFVGPDFRLTQAFMRDPVEEPALLCAVTQALQPCRALVTFNGKSFDAPLLSARYVVQGMEWPLAATTHLDLLPLARRLWRDRLESRALSFLEAHILGAIRTEEEVPGWLIPQVYFDYLRSGDARPLKGVFYHNAMDVVALAALFSHVTGLLDDPLNRAVEHGSDLVAVGKLLEDLGYPDRAVELYEQGLGYDLPDEVFCEAVRRLSFLQRRRGQTVAALELWRRAAAGQQLYAHVALAKFHEHQMRDYEEALRWTQAAINVVQASLAMPQGRDQWLADLQHRLARLQRKMGMTWTGKRQDGQDGQDV